MIQNRPGICSLQYKQSPLGSGGDHETKSIFGKESQAGILYIDPQHPHLSTEPYEQRKCAHNR